MTLGLFRKPVPERAPEPTDEQLLTFEAKNRPGAHDSRKDVAIRADLGITPARYYQLLGRLIWLEDALRIDPQLTNRLRRLSIDR
ncbi:MAG: hypothetical protein K0S37_3000 [Microbacterium sp.]|jgi:hypothetical protein|nr:hypothetical protein [Microbacterium sp.]